MWMRRGYIDGCYFVFLPANNKTIAINVNLIYLESRPTWNKFQNKYTNTKLVFQPNLIS